MKKLLTGFAALALTTTFLTAADAPAKAKGEGKKGMTPEERFKKLDANGDGKLSMDEIKASPQAKKDPTKAEGMFKRADKDKDGSVTLEEFTAANAKREAKAAAAAPKPEAAAPAKPAPEAK